MNRPKRKYTRQSEKDTKDIALSRTNSPLITSKSTTNITLPVSTINIHVDVKSSISQQHNLPVDTSQDQGIVITPKYIIPTHLKEILTNDYIDVNNYRDIKIFDLSEVMTHSNGNHKTLDLISNSKEDELFKYTIDKIMDKYIQFATHKEMKKYHLIPNICGNDIFSIITSANLSIDIDQIIRDFQNEIYITGNPPQHLNNKADSSLKQLNDNDKNVATSPKFAPQRAILVCIQEKLEYIRGIRLYLNTIFERYLLYKHERPLYNRFKAKNIDISDSVEDKGIMGDQSLINISESDHRETFLNLSTKPNPSKQSIFMTDSPQLSSYLGIVPLLRLFVALPMLLDRSGLKPDQISNIYSSSQEFLDFLELNL